MGNAGQVGFDLVQNGDYGDFTPVKGSANICAWTEFPRHVAYTPFGEPATFALTAPLSGCTIGALKTGIWFHRALDAEDAVFLKQLKVSLAAMRAETLNFIFGPEEYDPVSKTHCPKDPVQVIVFGIKMPDTKYTFWAQWQKRINDETASRLTWKQIGRYPNA